MKFTKRKFPRRSIKRDAGQIEWVMGLYFVLILGIVLISQLQIAGWMAASGYLEDTLAASNLAAAVADIREYGKTNKIVIRDPVQAYRIFYDAVKENLNLNEEMEFSDSDLFEGPVEIRDFIVYNVDGDEVEVCRVLEEGNECVRWSGRLGEIYSPDGVLIESASVYSEISVPVRGVFGMHVTAHKQKLVDITD